ncbi:MAG: phosphoesterase [Chlamydiae bacterium SM23_39]|nr:MAG: phosphoesterase [Chlamydiae bacterium SM23_39]
MNIWAISDLHLCFSVKEKNMEIFGKNWIGYVDRVRDNWVKKIKRDDLVLVAGDISWAKNIYEAKKDLEWIDALPGKKVIIKGNHDYWWPSKKKLIENLPPSISFIQNNAYNIKEISIGGTRLWNSDEYNFDEYIKYTKNPYPAELYDNKKIFSREIERLNMSLRCLDLSAKIKIIMTHFPPISGDLKDSEVSKILEKNKIDIVIFGHLHNIEKNKRLFGEKNGIKYLLTSCDYLNFDPIKIWD